MEGAAPVERFKCLDIYQKVILLLMAAMTLVFAVVYAITIGRVGFAYRGAILVPSQENGSTVYSGKVKGLQARFIVSEDRSVVFQYGDQTYGPYTVTVDPAAVPEDAEQLQDVMTGVELRRGDEVWFRGGIFRGGDNLWLYNEDGRLHDCELFYAVDTGNQRIEYDGNGKVMGMEPTALTILKLMDHPELTHKGDWFAWFTAAVLCVLNALSILFADELFRWQLSFRIRCADRAEPSDWELIGRYISWVFLTVLALVIWIVGLR